MLKKINIGVIGLGKFGLTLSKTLMAAGHEVIGVDNDDKIVNFAQDFLTKVYHADASDKTVLTQLNFAELDVVVVSVGGSMEASVLISMNLLDLGVKKIIAKAALVEHSKVLRRIGVHSVIQPEIEVAKTTAQRIMNPGMLDFLPFSGGIVLQEIVVESWAGKSLVELNLAKKYGVLVVATRKNANEHYQFVPKAHLPFSAGDMLMLIGSAEAIEQVLNNI